MKRRMDAFSISDSISFVLMEVCKLRRAISDTMLNEIGLHVGQEMFFVSLLQEEGATQSEIADRLHVQRATVTNMLQRLEHSGWIERRGDKVDQRVLHVYLTESGRALQYQLQQVWREIEDQTTQGMTLEERLLFRRLLLQAYQNLLIHQHTGA
ncbi:MAG: MarR family transcriptional regulator [Chloroflexota bacterium]|nr:MarR family transcriptional regulator [Chloroflexota bacterium]